MNYEYARKEGDFSTTSLVGSRDNVDMCVAIGCRVADHEHEYFPELLKAVRGLLAAAVDDEGWPIMGITTCELAEWTKLEMNASNVEV